MKKILCVSSVIAVALFFLSGCVTTSLLSTGSKKKTEKGAYAKVPESLRGEVKKAEEELKAAEARQILADEILSLAKMKKDRAILGKKYAALGLNIEKYKYEEIEHTIVIKKWEAIDNSELGEKEKNAKMVSKLTSKKLKVKSKRLNAEADYISLDIKIKESTKKINSQENKVQNLKKKAQEWELVNEGEAEKKPDKKKKKKKKRKKK